MIGYSYFKAEPMKRLLLVAIPLLMVSCQKSTEGVLVKDEWEGIYTIDIVVAKDEATAKTLATNCAPIKTWDSTKIESYNNGEPEAVARTWQEISVGDVAWIDKGFIDLGDGRWQREYFTYKNKR